MIQYCWDLRALVLDRLLIKYFSFFFVFLFLLYLVLGRRIHHLQLQLKQQTFAKFRKLEHWTHIDHYQVL